MSDEVDDALEHFEYRQRAIEAIKGCDQMFLVVQTDDNCRMIHSGVDRLMIGSVFTCLQDATKDYLDSIEED